MRIHRQERSLRAAAPRTTGSRAIKVPKGADSSRHPTDVLAFAKIAQVALVVIQDSQIAFASEQAERMLGYAPGKLTHKSIWPLVAPEEVRRLRKFQRRRDQEGAPRGATTLETIALRQGGDRLWVELRITAIAWNGGTALLGLLTDISARKTAQEALKESERRYRQLVESSLQGIAVIQDGRIVMANQAFASIFGYPNARKIASGMAFTQLLARTERARFKRVHKSRLAGRKINPLAEYEGRRKDGTPLWFQSLAGQVDWGGKPAVLATILDISDRRRSEEELRSSQQLLQSIFETIPARVFVTDPQGRYVKVNPEHAHMLGKTPAQLIGQVNASAVRDIGIPSSQIRAEDRAVLKAGRRVDVPARRVVTHKGEERWSHIVKVPLRNSAGKILGQLALLMDVTEQERAQQDLRKSQQLLQAVFDAIPERLFAKDRSGRYLKINAAQAEAFGVKPDDATRMTTEEFGRKIGASPARVLKQDAWVLRTGKRLEVPETLRRLANGEARWYRVVKVPLRDERGQITGIVGLGLDVTERRKAEDALRASEHLLQAVFDAVPGWLFVKDREGRYLKINAAQAKAFGISPSDVGRMTTEEFGKRIGANFELALKQDAWVMRTGKRLEAPESLRRLSNGEERWSRLVKVPLLGGDGRIMGIVGLGMDVTERRNAEDALRASEQLLQTVFDALPVGVFVKDTEGRYLRVNRLQSRYYGMSPEEFRGKHWEALASRIKGDVERARIQDEQVLRHGASVDVSAAEFIDRGGRRMRMRIIKVPLRDAEDRITGLVGMSIDTTEQLQAAEALRASEALLQSVFDAIPEPMFVKDRGGRFMKVNLEMARVYGVTPAEMVGKPWAYVTKAGADPKVVRAEDELVMRTGQRLELPDMLRKTHYGPRWYRFVKVPLHDAAGEVTGLISLAMDVTARHHAENALRAQGRLLQTAFDAIPLRITVKDPSGRFLMVNRAHSESVGHAAEESLGKTIDDLAWVPEWRRKLYADVEAEVIRTKRSVEVPEVNMELAGGVQATARMVKVPILDDRGEVEGVVTLWEDITARLIADQELRRSRRLLQTVFNAIPHEMTVKDAAGRYLAANRAYAERFGISESDLMGLTVDEVRHFDLAVRNRLRDADRRVLESRTLQELLHSDAADAEGKARTRRILKMPLLDEGGKAEGIVTLAEDITERLASDQELHRSRMLLQTIFDIMPHYLWVRDNQSRFVMANLATAAYYGLRPEELIGKSVADHHPDPSVVRFWEEEDRKVIETGLPYTSPDFEAVHADGRRLWLHAIMLPLRDESGKIVGVTGLVEDITARKRAELELQTNQRLLEEAQAVGHTGSWSGEMDVPGTLWWSEEVYRIFGVARDAFDGRFSTVLEYVHPDDKANFIAHVHRVVKGKSVYDHEHRIICPDGTVRWVHERADVQRDENGRASRMIGFVQDITERKTAELALLANERLLQAVLDAIPHNVFVKDRNSRLVLVNKAHNRFWNSPGGRPNLDTAELPGLSTDVADMWMRTDREVMETGKILEREGDEVRLSSGKKALLRWIKVPWRDENDQIVGLVGLSEDITTRVETEQALRTQQRLLQVVFDTIPYELFVKDLGGSFVFVNQTFAAFYGLTPEQVKGLPTRELPGVEPRVMEQWLADDKRVIATGQAVTRREFRYVTPDNREIWFDLRKFPWRDGDNRVVGTVGLREDITERRHTEELARANRRLLRTVFDTIPHLVYVKDAQSRYIMVNEALAQVYGMTPDLMAGTHTLDLPGAIEDQRQDLLEADRRVIETGAAVYQPEVPIFEGPRGMHWYNIIKLPLRDEHGKIVGIVGMSEDISERRRSEMELKTNRRLLRAVFDEVPFWLMVRDRDGRATLANRRMAEDYGVQPDDFIGKTMQDDPHLHPEEKAAMTATNNEVMRTLRPAAMPEMSLTLPGGRTRLMRIVVIPLFDDTGTREGELILAEDITDRRRSEQALLQAQKLESLGVLAGGVAHDFNNLLVAILGNASLAILKLKEGAAGHEELKQIELAGQRAAELCRQMLAYAGKGPLEMQRVDANAVVHEMTQLLRVSLPKSAAVTFRLAQNLPAVRGDPTQIRQVVMNLVINAGEAIGDRQGVITISSGTQEIDRDYLAQCQAGPDVQPGTFVFLEVSDTGHGMSAETLARVFDPFFTTKFTGRGLGLASVIGIIRGHGGALRVYSEVGVGSAFRMFLPQASPTLAAPASEPPPVVWKQGGLVLVVDDESEIRSVAERMLKYLGFSVISAQGGIEALTALRTAPTPLHAALVDLTMPGMTGEEVVREVRRLQPDLPVLVMSGYNESDMQSRFVGRHQTEFMQKPFTLAALHAKMRTLLGDPDP